MERQECKRIDKIEERPLLVVTVERGEGTKESPSTLEEFYYEKDRNGDYQFLFCKKFKKRKRANLITLFRFRFFTRYFNYVIVKQFGFVTLYVPIL